MKKSMIPTLKKMAKNLQLEADEESRGLEHKTPKGSKKRKENRFLSIDAVLSEQERQWEQNREDPNFLAEVYRQSSAHCQMSAYLVAKSDEEFVKKHVWREVRKDAISSGKNQSQGASAHGIQSKTIPKTSSQACSAMQVTRTHLVLSAAA
jgi:hypothetical protein